MSAPNISSLSDAWLPLLPLLTFTELLHLRNCSSAHRALFETSSVCATLLRDNCGLIAERLAPHLERHQQRQQDESEEEAKAKPKGSSNSKKNKSRRMKVKAAEKARREQQQQQDSKQQEEEQEEQEEQDSSSSGGSTKATPNDFLVQLFHRLLPCLVSVERLLLGHAIPPLHLAMLVQSLLLCPLPLHELAALHAPPADTLDMASWTDRFMLPQQPGLSLLFVHLPLMMWLRSPWSCPQWTAWWRWMLMRPPHRSFAVPTEAEEREAARLREEQGDFVLRELHGRVLWFAGMVGAVNGPERQEELAIGYLFGSVQRQADLIPSVCHTSVEECQRRMRDPQLDWSRLPIITYAIKTRRRIIRKSDSVWPHLAAFLLSSGSQRFSSFYRQLSAARLVRTQTFDLSRAARPLLIAGLDDGTEEREAAACEAQHQERQRQHRCGASSTFPPTRCPHFDDMLESMLRFADESVIAGMSNEEYLDAMFARSAQYMDE